MLASVKYIYDTESLASVIESTQGQYLLPFGEASRAHPIKSSILFTFSCHSFPLHTRPELFTSIAEVSGLRLPAAVTYVQYSIIAMVDVRRGKMRKLVIIPTSHTFTSDAEPSGKKRKASSPMKSSQTKKRGRWKAKQNVRHLIITLKLVSENAKMFVNALDLLKF